MEIQNRQFERSIEQIIAGLKEQLVGLGYQPTTILRYDAVWRKFLEYCTQNDVEVFTLEVGQQFVWERYGSQLGDEDTSHNVNRAMMMLDDFQRYGVVYGRSRNRIKEFSDNYKGLFEGFLEHLRQENFSDGSIKTWKSRLFRFEHFLMENGIKTFDELDLCHVNSYIETLTGFSVGTVAATTRILCRMFDYAFKNGYHHTNYSEKVIHVRNIKRYRLPNVLTPDEVERVLKVIDRNNPLGKRNYAIISLVAKLGLRISDVLNLKPGNIDWTNKKISITQKKTGNPLELPLPEDVGWAIIDYLQNGRPKSTCEHVFIQHQAPFHELSGSTERIVLKYFNAAGIKIPIDKPKGMHVFRHSLASALLKNGNSLTEISQVLGHSTPESTEVYVSIDVEMLRKCALEVMI